jgi:hypothetical protein
MTEKMQWKHVVYEDSVPIAAYDDKGVANRFMEAGSPGTTITIKMFLASNVPDGLPDNPWQAQLAQGLQAWSIRYSISQGAIRGAKRVGAMSMPIEERDRLEYAGDNIYFMVWATDGTDAAETAQEIADTLPLDELESEHALEDMKQVEMEFVEKQPFSFRRLWPFSNWGAE